MALIADVLLISGAFGAALYCMILSRRLSRLSDLDGGVGKAIADLNAQVADLNRTLHEARGAATASADTLSKLTERAETVAATLEGQLDELDQSSDTGTGVKPNAERGAGLGAARSTAAPQAERDDGTTMPAFVRGRAMREAAE